MKKIIIVSLMSLLFLMISSMIAYFIRFIPYYFEPIQLVITGIIVLIFSGIFAGFAKENIIKNVICFIISGIALGILIRAWYVFRSFDNSLLTMFLVSVACILYLWIFYLLAKIPFFRKYFNLFFLIYFVISIICYVLVIANTKTTYVSTFGYYMIIEIAFMFALCSNVKSLSELIRNITLSTYSVFIVAIIILIFILSGDADFDLSGFDLGIGGEDLKSNNTLEDTVEIDTIQFGNKSKRKK